MSTELAVISVSDISLMATAIAGSKLFGMKTKEEAFALMLIAQAEGLHPAIAARDYHIIQGRPTLKADAMLARFQASGGKVEWHSYTDECCDATISHPQGGTVRVMWDMARVKKAQISNAAMYSKYPRNMLRARVVSEGIRTVYPGVVVGVYTPEEAEDFEPKKDTTTIDTSYKVIEREKSATNKKTANQEPPKQTVADYAKAYEIEIQLCDTEEKLDVVVKREAEKMSKLASVSPKWHSMIIAALDKQRASFEPVQEVLAEAAE